MDKKNSRVSVYWSNSRLIKLFLYIYIYIDRYIPRTQMTLVLVGKSLVLIGWPSKIEVTWGSRCIYPTKKISIPFTSRRPPLFIGGPVVFPPPQQNLEFFRPAVVSVGKDCQLPHPTCTIWSFKVSAPRRWSLKRKNLAKFARPRIRKLVRVRVEVFCWLVCFVWLESFKLFAEGPKHAYTI